MQSQSPSLSPSPLSLLLCFPSSGSLAGLLRREVVCRRVQIAEPEILDFKYDRDSGIFQAVAEGPLHFTNNALGYEVTFLMEEFSAQLYEDNLIGIQSFGNAVATFTGRKAIIGIAYFQELSPADYDQSRAWKGNRLIAYNGSQRHFLKSLCDGRLKEEGFAITGAKSLGRRSSEYRVEADTLIHEGVNPEERIVAFPHYLKVTCKKEKDEVKYNLRMLQHSNIRYRNFNAVLDAQIKTEMECSVQESWIKVGCGGLAITTSGLNLSGGHCLISEGYWRWDAPPEFLPTDFSVISKQ